MKTIYAVAALLIFIVTASASEPDIEPWMQGPEPDFTTVPWPWTAVAHDGASVSVWGRRYDFAGAALPRQIDTRGVAILAGPVRWRLRVAGEEIDVQFVGSRIESDQPQALITHTSERTGGFDIDTLARIEFDGMMWFDCTFTPRDGAAALERLDLLIPLMPEYSRYRHFPGHKAVDRRATGANDVTPEAPFSRALPRYGFCWLGDEERGLTWFFTEPGQFHLDNPDAAIMLQRTDEAMTLRVCFVDRAMEAATPLRISFGLVPTPTKPLPDGWRMRGTQRWIGEDWVFPWTREGWSRYGAGFPESNDPQLYRLLLDFHRRHRSKVAPYMILTWRDRQSPLWQRYQEDWKVPGAISDYSKTRPFWFGHYVCAHSESYRRWMKSMLPAFISDYDLDGLYHDIQETHFCTNASHGCDGAGGAGRWNILAVRDLNRWVYTLLHEDGRGRMKFDHSSAIQHDALSSFADAVVGGEELCSDGIGDKPQDVGPLLVFDDYFKVERIRDHLIATGMVAGQRGPIPWFLPELRGGYESGTRGLLALLLPTDVWTIWRGRGDFRLMHSLDRAARDFGLGENDVEFHGYWRDDQPMRTAAEQGPTPIVSLWHRFGHGTLIVVANHSMSEPLTARLDFDLSRLGFAAAEAADAEHQLHWTPMAAPGRLRVQVQPKDFRLLWLRSAASSLADGEPPLIAPAAEAHIGGHMPAVADAPQSVTVGELREGATTSFAQPLTLRKPVRITAVSLLLSESAAIWDFKVLPQPPNTINQYTLRPPLVSIVRAGPDGLPGEAVVPHEWITYTECRPHAGDPMYRTYFFDRAVDLDPGQYLILLAKEAESEQSSHCLSWHAVPALEGKSGIAFDGARWTTTSVTAAAGVYGYLR